jgi:hypothetical protein
MVEVFKTNVTHPYQADMVVDQIHHVFANYRANFDLEDCDKILRVKSINGFVISSTLIDFISKLGFRAEVLPDEPASLSTPRFSSVYLDAGNHYN